MGVQARRCGQLDGRAWLARTPDGRHGADGASIYDTSYCFDAAERLDLVTDGFGKDTSYGYDADGNRNSCRPRRCRRAGEPSRPGHRTSYDGAADVEDHQGPRAALAPRYASTIQRQPAAHRHAKGLNARATRYTDTGATPTQPQAAQARYCRAYDSDDLITGEYFPGGTATTRPALLHQAWERDTAVGQDRFQPHPVGGGSAPTLLHVLRQRLGRLSSDEEIRDPELPTHASTVSWSSTTTTRRATGPSGSPSMPRRARAGGRSTGPSTTTDSSPPRRQRRCSMTRSATRALPARTLTSTTPTARYPTYTTATPPARRAKSSRATSITRDDAEREVLVDETWGSGEDIRSGYDAAATDDPKDRWPLEFVDRGVRGLRWRAQRHQTTTLSYDRLDRETEMR